MASCDHKQLTSAGITSPSLPSSRNKMRTCCPSFKFAAPMSILLWNFLIQMGYSSIVYWSSVHAFNSLKGDFGVVLNSWIGGYALIGLMFMLYPVGGLIADLRYGRYKVIKLSLINNWVGAIIASVMGVLHSVEVNRNSHRYPLRVANGVASFLFVALFVLGIGVFQSNAVQFGLDQRPDASSEELSLFLHWFVWTEYIGDLFPHGITTISYCLSLHFNNGIGFSTLFYLTLSTVGLTLACCKRRWFNCENVAGNPYRNVYRVLKFAAKHGKPLGHRSALTYSDDVRPSRIDFAKQKYGGIFTTEVVEDVKTLLRILLMLLAITPTFYFDVSTSYLFPIIIRTSLGKECVS